MECHLQWSRSGLDSSACYYLCGFRTFKLTAFTSVFLFVRASLAAIILSFCFFYGESSSVLGLMYSQVPFLEGWQRFFDGFETICMLFSSYSNFGDGLDGIYMSFSSPTVSSSRTTFCHIILPTFCLVFLPTFSSSITTPDSHSTFCPDTIVIGELFIPWDVLKCNHPLVLDVGWLTEFIASRSGVSRPMSLHGQVTL